MASITDKFGRPSLPTDYALATTVKTARTEGETVLACYDLSRFSQDTPVFFVTYKKTTDPITNEVTVTNQTSWKALVNPDNNTLTNLTLAPGYEDIGNDIGDFVECIPTSYWGNSLIDGLMQSFNPDGSLKVVVENPGWTPLTGTTVSSVTDNGQHSHTVVLSADRSSVLSAGQRVRITHDANNIQCMDFESASSQYAGRAAGSVAGVNLTTTVTLEAQIKLESYTGSHQYLMTRRSGAPGWGFTIDPNGRLFCFGNNGSLEDTAVSIQSVPTSRWVHVAYTWDIGTSTLKFYIDGHETPINSYNNSAAATFGNAGDLRIACNATAISELFDGKMKEVRLWNTIRTATELRQNKNNSISPSSPGLIGYWKGDGNFNDSTANANHLTGINGAIATAADAPWGIQADGTVSATKDYALIHKIVGTSVTLQTPEGGAIPTTGTFSLEYSGVDAPQGFPKQEDKWDLVTWVRSRWQQNSVVNVYMSLGGTNIIAPIGSWKPRISVELLGTGTSMVYAQVLGGLSLTAAPTWTPLERPVEVIANSLQLNASQWNVFRTPAEGVVNVSSAAIPLYMIGKTNFAGAPIIYLDFAEITLSNSLL